MSTGSFARELADRLSNHDQYKSLFATLQSLGVIETLARKPGDIALGQSDIARLLYCAEVFVQTEDEDLHKQAQEIAIHTLLVSSRQGATAPRERALALLTELGNFPGLNYFQRNLGASTPTLLGLINRRVSESLNTVSFGQENRALTAYQKRVWNSLRQSRASVISAPTSAGKSFLVVEHLCRLAERLPRFRAAYVTPTRALLSEIHEKVQRRLKDKNGVRVSAIPTLENDKDSPRQIFVLTQERLNTLLSSTRDDFAFDLVVVDEAQNIADESRGMILQDCLERVAERSQETQIILLAPGAEGLQEVAKAFGIAELTSLTTRLSPVQQNRIILKRVRGKPKNLSMVVIGQEGKYHELGTIELTASLNSPKSRLALVALELGGEGSSLLYETGPRAAEKTATHLAELLKSRGSRSTSARLEELSKFIKEHVHKEYQLAQLVRYGVAFHYGRMPSLLREAIETAFKEGEIRFLVCTTTLAQGVNLPARNVFIDTPKYGQGKNLNPALLWNFAGRAGRLNQDVVGNVFLLDYDSWQSKPMDKFVPFTVESATSVTLRRFGEKISEALNKGVLPKFSPSNAEAKVIRSAAGLLVAHAARKDVGRYLQRILNTTPQVGVDALVSAAQSAYEALALPDHILAENWTIDPFGLKRLYNNILEKIDEGEIDKIIPINPNDAPSGFYESLFGRIVEQVNGESRKFGALAGRLAVDWMKGMPYPAMLGSWIARQRRSEERKIARAEAQGETPPTPKTVDALIYEAFSLIEDQVRFEFVQLGKAYRDLLIHALRQTQNSDLIPQVFDFALALELGISSKAGTAYVELGLSRIAASALEQLSSSDGPLSAAEARQLLRALDVTASNLSPIIVTELRRLGLVQTEIAR